MKQLAKRSPSAHLCQCHAVDAAGVDAAATAAASSAPARTGSIRSGAAPAATSGIGVHAFILFYIDTRLLLRPRSMPLLARAGACGRQS